MSFVAYWRSFVLGDRTARWREGSGRCGQHRTFRTTRGVSVACTTHRTHDRTKYIVTRVCKDRHTTRIEHAFEARQTGLPAGSPWARVETRKSCAPRMHKASSCARPPTLLSPGDALAAAVRSAQPCHHPSLSPPCLHFGALFHAPASAATAAASASAAAAAAVNAAVPAASPASRTTQSSGTFSRLM